MARNRAAGEAGARSTTRAPRAARRAGIALSTALLAVAVSAAPALAAPKKAKIRFSASAYQVAEGGTATITVTRTQRLTESATVKYATSDGTATSADYTPASGEVTFPALPADHTQTSQSATFTVSTLEDGATEANETVNLSLRSTRRGNGGGARSTLTIVDNDGASRVSYAAASISAGEAAGLVEVRVLRAGDASAPAEVSYDDIGGSAPAGDWQFGSATQTLTFDVGEHVDSFFVMVNDNTVADGHRTVDFGLTPVSNAQLEAPSSSTLTILDDETPSVLRFESATASIAEDDGEKIVYLTVTRAGSSTDQTVSVDYATSNGTATAGSDYVASTGTVTLAGQDPAVAGDQGEETDVIEIEVKDDALLEGDETFDVTLSNPTAGALIGSPSAATVTIVNVGGTTDGGTTDGGTTDGGTTDGGTTDGGTTDGGTTDGGTTTGGTASSGTAGTTAGSSQTAQPLEVRAKVRRKRLLRKRGVIARVRCSRDCDIVAKGRVRIGRKAKRIRLKKVARELVQSEPTKVKLRLGKKARRALVARLGDRKRVRVIVRVRATDASGQTVVVKRKLRLRVR